MKSRDSLIRLKRFQVEERRRRMAQIEAMIAEFARMSADLDREIALEEQRAASPTWRISLTRPTRGRRARGATTSSAQAGNCVNSSRRPRASLTKPPPISARPRASKGREKAADRGPRGARSSRAHGQL